MKKLLVVLLVFVFDVSSCGAITLDLATGTSCSVCAGITYAHTVGTGSDTVLIVGATQSESGSSEAPNVTSVTYALAPLTGRNAYDGSSNGRAGSQLSKEAPATGSNNVVITLSGLAGGLLQTTAISYFGVDQTTVIESSNTAVGNSATPAVTVSGVSAGSVVVDHSCHGCGFDTVGANQTQRYQSADDCGKSCNSGASSDQAGADGGVMSWSTVGSDSWLMMAISLKAAAAGGGSATYDASGIIFFQ